MVLGNVDLSGAMATLENIGLYEVALPFILIFTIIFAVLQKINLFGKNTKNFNVIVALVIALFATRVSAVVTMMNSFLPKANGTGKFFKGEKRQYEEKSLHHGNSQEHGYRKYRNHDEPGTVFHP